MKLLYIMDPMCSWCWAFSPTLQSIRQSFPDLPVEYILGGLAPDTETPMPQNQQHTIHAIWKQIEERTGTQFNYDFWTQCTPKRSTWRSCRAVITAGQLLPNGAELMTNAIQHAYYLNAQNPSDAETLISLAESLGINTAEFAALLDTTTTQEKLQEHMATSRQLDVSGFPALRLVNADKIVRISDGYSGPDTIIECLKKLITGQ